MNDNNIFSLKVLNLNLQLNHASFIYQSVKKIIKINPFINIFSSNYQIKHYNKIYHSENPSSSMQTKTHTAFPHIDSKPEPYNPKIAVLSAVNKLKETQDRILQAKKRQIVQKRIQESILAREEQKRKSQLFKKMVRNSLQMEKSSKRKSNSQRQKQIEKLHELNSTFRQTKFRFRQTVKSMQKQENQKIYQKVKSQRQKHEQMVKEFKNRELQLKKSHRQRMAQRQEKSKQRVQLFRQSRIVIIQKERQKDVQQLQKKIETKARYLQKLNESQNNFANSRTRFRYRSNSSFQNDSNKQNSQQNASRGQNIQNIEDFDKKIKINSIVNPQHDKESNDKIFGLTQSKQAKIFDKEHSSENFKIKSSQNNHAVKEEILLDSHKQSTIQKDNHNPKEKAIVQVKQVKTKQLQFVEKEDHKMKEVQQNKIQDNQVKDEIVKQINEEQVKQIKQQSD